MAHPVEKTDEEWREQLTPEEYAVLRQAGTERAFTGEYTDTETKGVYRCRACQAALFESDTKFHSGCGWPSFYQPITDTVEYIEDTSYGMKRVEVGKRVRSILGRVGLEARANALPTQLSAGEQQRVGIARAVVAEPPLLIADEPTGNLDPALSAEIMALFAALPERGTSVLVASHDLALVKRMRKRVLVLDHGQLVDDISPEDLADE